MIIDQLTPTLSDNLTDEVPVEQGTVTLKATWQKVLNLFIPNLKATSGTPSMDGTAARGTADTFSQSDHVHPTDTSRASQNDLQTLSSTLTTFQTSFIAFTKTLSSASWVNNEQQLADANFKPSGYAYIVSPDSSSFIDYCNAQIYALNVTTQNRMKFKCVNTPTADITVNIVRTVSTT